MSTEYVWVKKNTEWKIYPAATYQRTRLVTELSGLFGLMALIGLIGTNLIH